MSHKNLVKGVAAVAFAMSASGCAVMDGVALSGLPRQSVTVNNDVVNTQVVLDPCSREGIKARPMRYITNQEFHQRAQQGETGYFYNGYYLFAKRSLTEQYAPLAGALLIGAAGSGIGAGVGRVVAAGTGGIAGAGIGEYFADGAKLARLAREAGCEQYLDRVGPAPQPRMIDNSIPDRRPINTTPRGLEQRQGFVQP